MKINLTNYEEYVLDYIEGNLSPEMSLNFQLFLSKHPEIEKEIDGISLSVLPDEPIVFANKNSLLIDSPLFNQSSKSTDEILIDEVEGQITQEEKKEIERIAAQHKGFNQLRKIYARTVLVPDMGIIYPGKNKLYKGRIIQLPVYVQYAAAAAVILLLGLTFYIRQNSDKNYPVQQIASNYKNNLPDHKSISIPESVLNKPKDNLKTYIRQNTVTLVKPNLKSEAMSVISEENSQKTKIEMTPMLIPQPEIIALAEKSDNQLKVSQIEPVYSPFKSNIGDIQNKNLDQFLTPVQYLTGLFRKKAGEQYTEVNPPAKKEESISPWLVASAGAGVVKNMTGTDVKLTTSYLPDGRVKSYEIKSGNFSFYRSR